MRTVVLFGNSLIISTCGASLNGFPGMQLLRIDPGDPDSGLRLREIRPDTLIFDLCNEVSSISFNLWKILPNLLLIGINPENNEILVLTGHYHQAQRAEDLVSIILGDKYSL